MTTAWRGANFRKQHVCEESCSCQGPVIATKPPACPRCTAMTFPEREAGEFYCLTHGSFSVYEPLPMVHERNKHPVTTVKTAQRGCDVEDCEQPHKARGYCNLHYSRLMAGLPVVAAKRTPRLGVAI